MVTADSTSIAGLPIPSTNPVFLGTLAVHVTAALVCVVTGALAALSPKQPGRHPRAGSIYVAALFAVTASMAVLAAMRWREDRVLFVIGVAALAAALWARRAMRRRQAGYLRTHIAGMGTSYTLLFVAFYVDNGPHLPLWRRRPTAALWLRPSVVGATLTVSAARRRLAAEPQGSHPA